MRCFLPGGDSVFGSYANEKLALLLTSSYQNKEQKRFQYRGL